MAHKLSRQEIAEAADIARKWREQGRVTVKPPLSEEQINHAIFHRHAGGADECPRCRKRAEYCECEHE